MFITNFGINAFLFWSIKSISLLQVRINLDEDNDIASIKNYLATNLPSTGIDPPRRGKFFRKFAKTSRNARRAFREIYLRLKEETFGNRPNVSNVCLLLVNEKKTSRYLKNSRINTFCDHTLVFSGKDEFDVATIQKKICPEAQVVRGMYD